MSIYLPIAKQKIFASFIQFSSIFSVSIVMESIGALVQLETRFKRELIYIKNVESF